MKTLKPFVVTVLLASFVTAPWAAFSADKDVKAKPYPLTTCVVSGEKLGDMGKPYTFKHEGREIQLCCNSCLKDFKKDPAKYAKKVEEAQAKAGK